MSSSHVVEVAGKILIISIVVLSVVLIFVFFIHLYAKWFWYRREDAPNTRRHRRRRRGDFTSTGHLQEQQQSGVTILRRGLNPSFLNSIAVIAFDPKDFKQGLECAVCLSEVGEGEKTRILPKCRHGFHVECIDMWFHSHSSCPICRNPVSEQDTVISVENLLGNRQTQTEESSSSSSSTADGSGDSQDFPTNILFWGDESEVSTLTSQLEEANSRHHHHHHHQAPVLTTETASSSSNLVIDMIPTEIDCDEDEKSPVSSRMRSLRRILSGSRRFINPFTPPTTASNNNNMHHNVVDVEQGARAHL